MSTQPGRDDLYAATVEDLTAATTVTLKLLAAASVLPAHAIKTLQEAARDFQAAVQEVTRALAHPTPSQAVSKRLPDLADEVGYEAGPPARLELPMPGGDTDALTRAATEIRNAGPNR